MKILLLGKNGQVGWELQRSLSVLSEVVALDRHSTDFCGDLTRLDDLAHTIRMLKPQVIVNAAAHTAVDRAESEPDLAHLVNEKAPGVIAHEAAQLGALFVHFSTDYVFDGSGTTPWREDDATGPLSVYGQSKLAGENLIQHSGCQHLILRTSWVYAAKGANFAKTMLRLAQEREQLQIVSDQFGAPTGADLLADVAAHCIRRAHHKPELSGIYHCVAAGETNWYEYASFVIAQARQYGLSLAVQDMVPVPTGHFPTTAVRPNNSRLSIKKLESTFDLVMPPWQQGVQRMLVEIFDK